MELTKQLTRKLSIKENKKKKKLKPVNDDEDFHHDASPLRKTVGAAEGFGLRGTKMTITDGGITTILRERDNMHELLDNKSEGQKIDETDLIDGD